MHKKGQGALEYLLLIGGAVLVAVIVIVLLLSITDTGEKATAEASAKGLCTQGAAVLTDKVCANVGPIEVSNWTCTCSGTYPNCEAECV